MMMAGELWKNFVLPPLLSISLTRTGPIIRAGFIGSGRSKRSIVEQGQQQVSQTASRNIITQHHLDVACHKCKTERKATYESPNTPTPHTGLVAGRWFQLSIRRR
jgi:hypothetical protein